MLTRKQMNLLLQQVIHSQAYDFWIRVKKEGAAWQEERLPLLGNLIDEVSNCSGTRSQTTKWQSTAHGKPCAS